MSTEKTPTKTRSQLDAIKVNPEATGEEILSLSDVDALLHPNCPAEIWWTCASLFPVEAQGSVLFSMMTLEAPGRWAEMEALFIGEWITRMLTRLPRGRQELFAADCAARVLSLYEARYISKAPRVAMETRRAWGRGRATEAEWDRARIKAERVAKALAQTTTGREDEHAAAFSAAWAAARSEPDAAVRAAQRAIHNHAAEGARQQAVYEEQKWQWARVQQYANGEL